MKHIALLGLSMLPTMSQAANYTAERTSVDGIEVVRLADAARQVEVWIVPSVGNIAYDMKVKGKRVLWSPFASPAQLKQRPRQSGNPFLAPWANRIDGDAFYANGKKYLLNQDLKNYTLDQNRKPMHGFLAFVPWNVARVSADDKTAEVSSRLEFWRNPDWMAQFPFAHTLTMTYRLSDGVLEVQTEVENQSTEPMPLVIGYHTYYQLADVPRDQWSAHVPARDHLVLSPQLIPTGEQKPMELPDRIPLATTQLDDVFSGLVRGADGRAGFSVEGGGHKISVFFGPKYPVAVVYAPRGRDYICFEPMTGITNGFNLAHSGVYKDLQSVAPGQTWRESFWIQPSY
jgi:aldose 1-epimerase